MTRRILVLENVVENLQLYVRRLARSEYKDALGDSNRYEVESAATLEEAISQVDEKLYDVCVVDLMLNDPVVHDTYDGVHLLAAVDALSEGTLCIILSGQDRPGVAAKIVNQYDCAIDYIEKGSVSEQGSKVLVDAVQSAVGSLETEPRFLSYEALGLQMFGARGTDTAIAESRLSSFLKPRGGVEVLRKAFGFAMRAEFVPLRPRVTGPTGWQLDDENGFAWGEFWSKGSGQAVEVRASSGDLEIDPTSIHSDERMGIRFDVVPKPDLQRSLFTGGLEPALRNPLGE